MRDEPLLPDIYTLEDVTPERMALLDTEMRIQAQQGLIPNNLNRTNGYLCALCQTVTYTIDRHYGLTPLVMSCPRRACAGKAFSLAYLPSQVTKGPSVAPLIEWYRPLTEAECRLERETTSAAVAEYLADCCPEYDDEERAHYQTGMENLWAAQLFDGRLCLREPGT